MPFSRNPLYAGLNSLQRILYRQRVVMLTGRRATDGREPRQVRKEAAISDAVCVVERSRSFYGIRGSERNSIKGAQPSPRFSQSPFHVCPTLGFQVRFCACDFRFSQSSIFSIGLTLFHTELFFPQQQQDSEFAFIRVHSRCFCY